MDVVFANMDEPYPVCDFKVGDGICGEPLQVSWKARKAPGIKPFTPFYHDGWGMINNEDDWKRLRKAIAKNQACAEADIVLVKDSKAEASTVADEHRQRAYDRRKRAGLCDASVKEIRNTIKDHGFNPKNNKKARRSRRGKEA
jgi:hypothetical protein